LLLYFTQTQSLKSANPGNSKSPTRQQVLIISFKPVENYENACGNPVESVRKILANDKNYKKSEV
jgi:hypothetical protein